MALSSEQLTRLEHMLMAAQKTTSAQAASLLPQLRAGIPGLTITRCDTEDMRSETPWGRFGGYDLYLIDASTHCWRIITEVQKATGVVIAAHS